MTKVIYVLGAPYSGSTLFGLGLGQHSGLLNLGEVINIEHDWGPKKKCTCGEIVSNCKFWSTVKKQADSQPTDVAPNLSFAAGWDEFDQRGGLWKIALLLGAPMRWFWSAKHLTAYGNRAKEMFRLTGKVAGDPQAIVDLSKSGERYTVLKNSGLEPLLVYLYRDPASLYASSIKRPKRTRRFWGPKILREAFILRLRLSYNERIFRNTPRNKRVRIMFSDFIAEPTAAFGRTLEFINRENQNGTAIEVINSGREVDVNRQHIFVGNKWIFTRDRTKPITIAQPTEPEKPMAGLSRFEQLVLKFWFIGFRDPVTSSNAPN